MVAILAFRQAERTRRCQSGSMCQESAVQRAYAFELKQEISPDDPSTTPSDVAKPSPAATETTAASLVAQLRLSPDSICRRGVSGCYGLGSSHISVGEHGQLLGTYLALCLKCARRLYQEEMADGAKRGEEPSITLGQMGMQLIPVSVGIWTDPAPPTRAFAFTSHYAGGSGCGDSACSIDHTLRGDGQSKEDEYSEMDVESMQECQSTEDAEVFVYSEDAEVDINSDDASPPPPTQALPAAPMASAAAQSGVVLVRAPSP
jgi:hypothetical protein